MNEPLAKTASGFTVWAVKPGRVPGQETGLEHLTWHGLGDRIFRHTAGMAAGRLEFYGRPTGTVSGPCNTAAEAQQAVDAFLAGLEQNPSPAEDTQPLAKTGSPSSPQPPPAAQEIRAPETAQSEAASVPAWLEEILRIAGDIGQDTRTDVHYAAGYGYLTYNDHGEAWAQYAARNYAKNVLAGAARDGDPAVRAVLQSARETREKADQLLLAAAGPDGRVRADLDNPESLAADEAERAAGELYGKYSETHGEASGRYDFEVAQAWREADLDFLRSHYAELQAADPEGFADILGRFAVDPASLAPAAQPGEAGRDRLIEEAAERFPEYSHLDQQQEAIDADARANWNGYAYPPYEGPGYTEPPVNWEGWHTDHSEFERDHYWDDPGSHHAGLAADLEGSKDIPEARTEDSSPSAGLAPGPRQTRQSEPAARHAQGTANSWENGPDTAEGAGGPPVHPSLDFPSPVTPGIGARRAAPLKAVAQSSLPATRRTL